MLGGYKKILFFGISMLYVFPCVAQFIDDIPIFDETSATTSAPQNKASDSLVMAPKTEEKKEEGKKPEPNIGRKAIPLDKVVLTPDPLPEVSIDLRDKVTPPAVQTQPELPVNTRQEGIYISPQDKTETSSPQPSNFVNVHDVRQFDIEGFYLGMTPKAVLQMANQKKYFIVKTKKSFPLFQTSYYEGLCRQSGIHAPEMVRSCIRQYAVKNNQEYIKEITLTKKPTKESFHFTFTSPATGNEAYQIIYQNKGDNSLNFTQTNLAKKLNRKEAFFNAVFEMYGYPDDNKRLIWGNEKDAYMQVSMTGSSYDAAIKLVDMQLSNEDYFAAADWKAEQKSLYHFGFAE